ncbi:MAG: AzlD domain-containing protein [Planctomycetaceae bacterium]|nr:AzlD domain-containing protein [Planctomycetaceae bacterium]
MTHLGNWETFVTMIALAVGIAATRFLPFILFSKGTKLPPTIRYLGGALPHAAMAMLLVYCLKEVRPAIAPHGLPEVLGLVATAALHLWRGNVLLSIAGGTVFYMVLVQRVF